MRSVTSISVFTQLRRPQGDGYNTLWHDKNLLHSTAIQSAVAASLPATPKFHEGGCEA
jgi:hypothetical protein